MKNIIKSLIVMLSSVSLFASDNAGELSVSGTAKATYNILSGKTNVGKGLGITNELNFTDKNPTPKNLVNFCEKKKIRLIHISTDYVYNSKSIDPTDEISNIKPINYYGYSKREGEKHVEKSKSESIVIRLLRILLLK